MKYFITFAVVISSTKRLVKLIDIYIIKKFLGTFFFSLLLIISIAIVFDLAEKLEDFLGKNAPLSAIIFDYYLNFIPYFANLFSSLFTFIAVIFFTSRMATNTEIIAILSNGVSYRRMMFPYFISALIIAIFSFLLGNFVIPHSSKVRLDFEEKYVRNIYRNMDRNIHKQISPGVFIYFESYNNLDNVGYKFSMEKTENGILKTKLLSETIRWDSIAKKWKISNYFIREITDSMTEKISSGNSLDTALAINPADFSRRDNVIETMSFSQLNNFISEQQAQGTENIESYLIEKYERIAFPFATFILTLIGVSIASRKVRGGTGMHIGIGFAFSFSYIFFMQISTNLAIGSSMNPLLAVWMPNIIYSIIAIFLYRMAPK